MPHDALAMALDYHTSGLAPLALPIGSKGADSRWKQYQDRQPSMAEVRAMFEDGHDHNVALIGGRASENLMLIDCETQKAFDEWLRRLADQGIWTWTVKRNVDNGDPAVGGHFWLKTPVAVQGQSYGDWEIRAQGQYGLVPFSIHPGGSMYCHITGSHQNIFKLPSLDTIPNLKLYEAQPGLAISRLAWRLLKGDLVTLQRYATRSEAEQALCVSLINTGHQFNDIERLLKRHPGPGKFQELYRRDRDNALRYLRLTYESAKDFAETNVSEAYALSCALTQWANDRPWPGRTGATDHAVYLAHLGIVQACCKEIYAASCRDLAERAGVGRNTASNATQRLIDDHQLLEVAQFSTATLATRYRLTKPEDDLSPYWDTPSQHGYRECPSKAADVFRWSGLGKTGYQVYELLADQGRMDVAEIVELTGRGCRTVRRKLNLMLELGLAAQWADGSWGLDSLGDLEAAAWLLGTAGLGERQKSRHARQRALHRIEVDRLQRGGAR